ncbi:MAG: DUF5667 domain-containing protein [bacterium]|nr:DUF5667 domain-containing protein [bacterium]
MKSLKSQFKYALRQSAPRKNFQGELWSELDEAFEKRYRQTYRPFRRFVYAPLLAVFIFFVTGTGVYAYASPNVTDESVFYPVRQSIEAVEAQVPRAPQAEARFQFRLAERRLVEAERLFEQNRLRDDHLIDCAQALDRAAVELVKQAPELRSREALVQAMKLHHKRLKIMMSTHPYFADQGAPTPFEESLELRSTIQDIRTRIRESNLSETEREALLVEFTF